VIHDTKIPHFPLSSKTAPIEPGLWEPNRTTREGILWFFLVPGMSIVDVKIYDRLWNREEEMSVRSHSSLIFACC
jgi:hypothetical protein